MKKTLLTLVLGSVGVLGYSQQVIFNVLTPPQVAGSKPLTFATLDNQWTNIPDMLNPANAITGELAFVSDGTAADSLGCNALVNGSEVAGKIAVVYRGACPFGHKAYHAWTAGAIGVIIVNNVFDPEVIGMLADGDGLGAQVNVPVIMTSRQTGIDLTPHINSGSATAFIGFVNFENNLELFRPDVLRARYGTVPQTLVPNASDLSIPVGASIRNNGILAQTNVTLSATITYDGVEVYNESVSASGTLSPTASITLVLPTFTPAAWQIGNYEITYTASATEEEDFPADNVYTTVVRVDAERFSYSPWNPASESTLNAIYYQPSAANWVDFYEACVFVRSPYVSNLKASGMSFRALAGAGQTLEGVLIDVTAYEWLDPFDDLEVDPLPALFTLNEIDFGIYQYETNAGGTEVFVPFTEQPELMDNQNYLFCIRTNVQGVFFGNAGDDVNYEMTNVNPFLPLTPVMTGSQNFALGFGEDAVFSFIVHFDQVSSTSEIKRETVDITPYPNPTRDFVMIPYSGAAGSANLMIYDLQGKLLGAQNVNFSGSNSFQVDMNGLSDGTYVFTLQFDNNTTSTFKVVIAR